MKIKNLQFWFCLLTIITVFISCNEDDDTTTSFVLEDRTEQQAKDKDSLLLYLSTHYYNSSFFDSGTDHKYTDIVITELEEGEELPDGHTFLIDAIDTPETMTYLETDYEYYILRINQGGGQSPKFTDQVRVRYEGSSIEDGDVFDSSITPADLTLVGDGFNTFSAIKGWQYIIPTFNTATGFSIDGNGNVNYNNFGLGVMFIPSGLAYFSGTATGLSYDNLIFKFELLQFEEVDHDGDGIPTYREDTDGDIVVTNDDTDGDQFPDYIDLDDDGDDVATLDELIPTEYIINTNLGEEEPILGLNEYERSRSENAGVITINTVTAADSNNDNILDYLDENITINYNEDESN